MTCRERLNKTEGWWRNGGIQTPSRQFSRLDTARQRNNHCWNVKKWQCPSSISHQLYSPHLWNPVLGKQAQGPLQEPLVPLFQQVAVHMCVHPLDGHKNLSYQTMECCILPAHPATNNSTPPLSPRASGPKAILKRYRNPPLWKVPWRLKAYYVQIPIKNPGIESFVLLFLKSI